MIYQRYESSSFAHVNKEKLDDWFVDKHKQLQQPEEDPPPKDKKYDVPFDDDIPW